MKEEKGLLDSRRKSWKKEEGGYKNEIVQEWIEQESETDCNLNQL